MKTVPLNLKKLSDVLSKKVVRTAKFNKQNSKVNYLENTIPDATTLI